MKQISSARGWSYGCKVETHNHCTNVHVDNVCQCDYRRKCEREQRCGSLFDCGTYDQDRLLRFLLRKKHAPQKWLTRQAAIDKYERLYFRKCKPVVVKIFGRPR